MKTINNYLNFLFEEDDNKKNVERDQEKRLKKYLAFNPNKSKISLGGDTSRSIRG